MAVYLSLFAGAGQQFFTNAGVPLAGGKIFTYGAGGSTPQATYTTSAGNIAHSNPIVLDAAGRVPAGGEIWLTNTVIYKFVLKDASGVTIQTLDNVGGSVDSAALAASSGSSLIGFIQSGTGAVARTVQTKLREFVSVKDFGAKGDGITDDYAAVQAALNAANTVYFPAGTYLIKGSNSPQNDGLKLKSNQTIFGDGSASIIEQHSTCFYLVSANQWDGGTSNPADNIRYLHISDLAFVNNVGTFSEFKYLMNLNAVSDVVIERCLFKGWQGDALYIGSSNRAGVERHNERITVRDCVFNGVNRQNRNGISIIDVNTILIERNEFAEISKSGQPGCIDVEPDNNAFAIVKNITIRGNRMNGSDGGGVSLLLSAANVMTVKPVNFTIENNFITGCQVAFSNSAYSSPDDSTPVLGWLFQHNTFYANNFQFTIKGVRGVTFFENIFQNNTTYGEIGYSTIGVYDVSFIGNTWQNNARGGVDAIWIRNNTKLKFERNKFVDNGTEAPGGGPLGQGRGLKFIAGYSTSQLFFIKNDFSSPQGYQVQPIYVEGTHTLNNATCTDKWNTFLDATSQLSTFAGNECNRFTSAPTTGTWTQGNVVYQASPVSGGYIGWVCTTSGSPGTWKTFGAIS